VIAKAEQRGCSEAEMTAAIRNGATLFDLHNIGEDFASSGVREIDRAWED
jgi:hypothetical protein